jgi:hypothetical protein
MKGEEPIAAEKRRQNVTCRGFYASYNKNPPQKTEDSCYSLAGQINGFAQFRGRGGDGYAAISAQSDRVSGIVIG